MSGSENEEAKCVGVGTAPEVRKISMITRSERAASGIGKKVIGCNGEVRGGAQGVGVGGAGWRYGICLIHSLILSVE